jgi:hypothetical protein
MEIVKTHATGGDSVDMGCFNDRMTCAAQIVRPVLIRDEEQKIGPVGHVTLLI